MPVLIPPDASKALEYLVDKETRQLAGRKPDNRYLFATNGKIFYKKVTSVA